MAGVELDDLSAFAANWRWRSAGVPRSSAQTRYVFGDVLPGR